MRAADTGEEKAILAAIQTLFGGMAAHDAVTIKSAMAADARLIGVRGDRPAGNVTRDGFAQSIAANPSSRGGQACINPITGRRTSAPLRALFHGLPKKSVCLPTFDRLDTPVLRTNRTMMEQGSSCDQP